MKSIVQIDWRKISRVISLGVVQVGSVSVVIAVALGCADILSTKFLGRPIPGTVELTVSFMVLIVYGGLAYVEIEKSHIRITVLYERLGDRTKVVLDLLAYLLALLFFGVFAWLSIIAAQRSWAIREAEWGLIRYPLYPVKMVLALGVIWMAIHAAIRVFESGAAVVEIIRGRQVERKD